jgi:hypothetical protein
LSGKAIDNATNEDRRILTCSVVYGREFVHVQGVSIPAFRPMKEKEDFQSTISSGSNLTVKNPLFSPSMAYLQKQWLRFSTIWSRGIVDVLEHVRF